MRKFRLHQILAALVLAVTTIWVLTGEFASLGSHAETQPADAPASQTPAAAPAGLPGLRRVLVTVPPVAPYARIIRVAGVSEADKTSVLAARTSGIIRDLPVGDGTAVQAGQVVARLEGPEKLAAVDTGKALVIQRQAQSRAADQLAKSGEGARIAADTARADLAAAEAQLRAAQSEAEQLDVIAPFDGVIEDVAVEAGSWVQLGTEIATLLALDPLVIRGGLSERDRSAVAPGAAAEVEFTTGDRAEGLVRHVRNRATDLTRTFEVEVVVPNPDRKLPAGLSAELRLGAVPLPVVTLPRSAATLGADGTIGLRTVSADNRVGFLPVTIVDDTPEGLAVGGVPDGTRVIIAGQDLVTEGEQVEPVTAPAAAASGSGSETAEAGVPAGGEGGQP